MSNLSQQLDAILDKINQLLQQHLQLEEEHMKLLEENNVLKTTAENKTKKIIELENAVKVLKLSKTIAAGNSGTEEDKSELKKKINEMIREVDKCLALLNN